MKLEEFYKNKRIIITGNTGFKGSWLTKLLLQSQAQVIGLALEPPSQPNLFTILNLESQIYRFNHDIRDSEAVTRIFQQTQPEIVFHLAAQPLVRDSYEQPLFTWQTNLLGTVNVLEAIRKTPAVKAAVMITTDKVYENKEWIWGYRENDELGGYDPYSGSKAAAELAVKSYRRSFFNPNDYLTKHQTLIATARAGNVIGGGDWAKDRLVTDIVRSIFEKKEVITLRNPQAIRP